MGLSAAQLRFFLCAVLSAAILFAQSTAGQGISGQVKDVTGAAVSWAKLLIIDEGTGLARRASADENGDFAVVDLPAGEYTVSAVAPGFKKEVVHHNTLKQGVGLELNIGLQMGDQSESVDVQAEVNVLETTSGDLGYTISGDEAGRSTLNGRNFAELLQMLPGVSTTYTDGFGLFGGYGVNNSGQSINGGRTDSMTWNLDGADNKDNGGGGNNFININPNAIGEMRVLTANYSAESGTSSGAVVNISIRSGTKHFHGMVYEYWRNNYFTAGGFNAATAGDTKLRWNNFGANLGGPLLLPKHWAKDKLFFFVASDVKFLRTGATSIWTVPTAAWKTGNFGSTVIKDPTTQKPYPNNILPATAIDPNMLKLLSIYPNANSGTASYVFNETTPTNAHQEIVKVDYNLNEKNQISAHWAHDRYDQLNNTTNLIEYWRQIPALNTSIQWIHIVSPSIINVAQFTYGGNVIVEQGDRIPNPTFIQSFTRPGFGITLPTLYNASQDLPQVQISGFSTLPVSPLAFNNFNRIFDWKDSLTKIAGKNTLKMGILIMRSRKNQDNPPQINGVFNFQNNRTPSSGNAVADALLGDFQQYQEYGAVRQGWFRFWQVEPWIQDDWRVSHRLTLNFGLRWSYMQPQYSALNNTVQFLPQYFNPAQAATINPSNGLIVSNPNPYNGLVLTGSGFPASAVSRIAQASDPAVQALFHDLPQGGAYSRFGNFAPRFGFAFDPTGRQNTVLRGGFGMAYERIQGNFIFSAINNTPFNPVATVLNGNVEAPNQGAQGPTTVQAITSSHFLDMKDPRTMTWSLGVQRRVGNASVLTVSYVGSSAANLSFAEDINQPLLGSTNGVYLPGTKTAVNVNALRPYLGYSSIQELITGANFHYNSLQTYFSSRLPRFGTAMAAFTWAKGLTDANGYNYQPEDSYNLKNDYGTSSYSRNKVLALNWNYPVPMIGRSGGGSNWQRQLFGGWQVSLSGVIQSGLPVNITDSNTSSPGTAAVVGSGLRPDLVGDPYSGPGVGGSQYLNPLAFANPALNRYGNLGAYNIFLPRWINVNGSLGKSFSTFERYRWDFRVNVYNVANHLSVSSVNTGSFNGSTLVNGIPVSTTSNWGSVNGTTPPRTLEGSIRISF